MSICKTNVGMRKFIQMNTFPLSMKDMIWKHNLVKPYNKSVYDKGSLKDYTCMRNCPICNETTTTHYLQTQTYNNIRHESICEET